MSRTPDTPKGSLGLPVAPIRALILDPETGEECAPAVFDGSGRLLNAEAAIGEIVNPDGGGGFEGYYNNPEANAERVRDGVYWTGDLGYRDERGFFYFAGRSGDWLRVDGENFAATPVELVLARHPDVVARGRLRGAVAERRRRGDGRAPPAARRRGSTPTQFASFLARASPTCRPSAVPRFVRITAGLPSTATQKVLEARPAKRALGVQRPGVVAAGALAPIPGVDARRRRRAAGRVRRREREHLIGR